MSLSARKVIALNCTHYTICFDWSPTGGNNGTVGVRFIAFEEAIIFLRVRLFSLLTKCPQMKIKVVDWIITVGLFIRLGRCLPGLKPWFKEMFAGVYSQILLMPEGILNIMGLLKQISGLKYALAKCSHLVRKRQEMQRKRGDREQMLSTYR